MLTAAGMGGMTKVILAMKHGMIPPTINVESPMESGDGGFLLISSSVKPVPGPISENKSTQRSALLGLEAPTLICFLIAYLMKRC